ncbi:hypothetical protein [Campylobacter mucosalis]|uniref:hypothetical protein n=1 Tax=Campylobacter mucosalis TaxID=202 RepID=UPI001470715E|nr:hypothetical protein [Campylobacter mucosalis]
MKFKRWIFTFLCVGLVFVFCVFCLNFTIDMLFLTTNKNSFNEKTKVFNERVQKSNFFLNHTKKYDAVLVGTSRCLYMRSDFFSGMKIFNYCLPDMDVSEYKPYIDFFKELNGTPKFIILNADFCSAFNQGQFVHDDPTQVLKNAKDKIYRLQMFFSVKNAFNSVLPLNENDDFYDRELNKFATEQSDELFKKYNKSNIEGYFLDFTKHWNFNDEYFNLLKSLKNENKTSKFIVYTPPIAAELFATEMIKAKQFERYKEWLRGLVEIFGEVYAFMDINSITTDLRPQNYKEVSHFMPSISKIVAEKLTENFSQEPKDFGVIVDKNNVESFLNEQERKLKEYKFIFNHIK